MQTIFQVLIGMSPLLLVSIVLLLKKSLKVLPLVALGGCLVVAIVCAVTGSDGGKSEASKRREAASSDYTYLANNAISAKDISVAKQFAAKINKKSGDSTDATLVYARTAVLEGDYTGAKVLYAKILAEKELPEADKSIYNGILSGEAMSNVNATAALNTIEAIKKAGEKPADYGYTDELVEKLKKASSNDSEYVELVTKTAEAEAEKAKGKDKKHSEDLSNAFDVIKSTDEVYDDYVNNEYDVDTLRILSLYKKMKELYKSSPEIFAIDEIDQAYVEVLVMSNEGKELAKYALDTDSQRALVTLSQLIIDGQISEKDVPKEFVSLSAEERKALAEHCEEIYKECIKVEKLEGVAAIELKKKVELVDNMAEMPVLSELESRIDPGSEALEDQSSLYLGSSALYYSTGNNEEGDELLKKAIETSEFSSDSFYANALKKVSGVIYDTVDSNEIKNVSEYIKNAYKAGVIHANPNLVYRIDEEKGEHNNTITPPIMDPEGNEEGGSAFKYNTAMDAVAEQGTTYTTTQSAKINISKLDISNFPEVKTTIATSSPLDLKNLTLSVNDANVDIDDYKIEKVNYSSAKIYMVCDKSGSMRDRDGLLREAVRGFAESIGSKEQMAVVGFSGSVEFASELSNNIDELNPYIDKLVARGNTNIAAGAFYAVEALAGSKDSLNVVVVMTDGRDDTFGNSELKKLKTMCDENNIVLYTIGLGEDIETEYLRTISSYGNGSFMYCNSANELASLYAFIHAQVENTYNIDFTAKDTTTNKRVLGITNTSDGSFANKTYYLVEEENEEVDDSDIIVLPGEVRVDGFDSKKIYKKDTEVKTMISGSNFTSDMTAIVTITGDAYKDSLTAVYAADSKFEVTIPAEVPSGKYTARITIGGYTMNDEIEILLPGKAKTFTFGAYTFTAQDIEETDQYVNMSGDVCMNGFLHFNGDVSLTGDVKGGLSLNLNDSHGSYITFTSKLPGLLGSAYGQTLCVGRLGDLTIYDDKLHKNELDEYNVEMISIPFFEYAAFNNVAATVALYPHKLSVKIESMSFEFPSLDSILTPKDGKNGLEFLSGGSDNNVEGFANGSGLYIRGELSTEGSETSKGLGSMKLKLGELKLKFDTFKHDYEFTCKVKTNIVPSVSKGSDDGAYGFDIGFKGGKWDSVTLYADFPVPVCAEPPVTLSDFFAGVKDMASVDQNAKFAEQFFSYTFKGGCDISVCKIADICPPLKAITGDVSLLTLDETTLEFSILNWKYELSTKLKVLGVIDYGGVKVKLGKYDYEDFLLDVDKDEVVGLSIETKNGPDISFANIKVSCQGTDSIDVNNKGFVLKKAGDVNYDINLIKHFKNTLNATFELAIYDGKGYIIVRGSSKDKAKGFKLCVNGLKSSFELY